MSALATLLDLQGHDVSLDQLRHRRASLPERAELAGLAKRDVALDTAMAADSATLATVTGEQKRLEDEVARIVAKVTAEDKKLYSGTVSAPKELQAIQDEIKSLNRRRNALEDDILVQMEAAEPLDAALGAQRAQRAELDAQLADGAQLPAPLAAALERC